MHTAAMFSQAQDLVNTVEQLRIQNELQQQEIRNKDELIGTLRFQVSQLAQSKAETAAPGLFSASYVAQLKDKLREFHEANQQYEAFILKQRDKFLSRLDEEKQKQMALMRENEELNQALAVQGRTAGHKHADSQTYTAQTRNCAAQTRSNGVSRNVQTDLDAIFVEELLCFQQLTLRYEETEAAYSPEHRQQQSQFSTSSQKPPELIKSFSNPQLLQQEILGPPVIIQPQSTAQPARSIPESILTQQKPFTIIDVPVTGPSKPKLSKVTDKSLPLPQHAPMPLEKQATIVHTSQADTNIERDAPVTQNDQKAPEVQLAPKVSPETVQKAPAQKLAVGASGDIFQAQKASAEPKELRQNKLSFAQEPSLLNESGEDLIHSDESGKAQQERPVEIDKNIARPPVRPPVKKEVPEEDQPQQNSRRPSVLDGADPTQAKSVIQRSAETPAQGSDQNQSSRTSEEDSLKTKLQRKLPFAAPEDLPTPPMLRASNADSNATNTPRQEPPQLSVVQASVQEQPASANTSAMNTAGLDAKPKKKVKKIKKTRASEPEDDEPEVIDA